MNIFLADEQTEPVSTDQMVGVAERVLLAERMPDNAEVAIVLVGKDEMAGYNQRFMERSGPTDVLAFPVDQMVPGEVPTAIANGQPLSLGDIFICPAVVRAQASDLGVSLEDEMALIVTHGILHLLGYDHADPADAAIMSARERAVLAAEGIELP
ncbi:MAG: rRNA maturation RNase YbeY [Acidimicrobiia bacterium]|nr:rRNA maturation RNase YbeY [Acidimicrobiia bacterium]MBT8192394.1 rRNA maturation RNase YbeY [Acidimicrobiia bacterium]MBT8247033.1 rRNA maturation RNase YbeY [Acidimicrobiia bacterium]NNF87068.1 rRNA maturation RNase YbeY [Acidimicrobiia bacterium]NNJ46753.1 rRNA maturation RNase YbeY [Acidimicrobiia bacterium]